MEMGLDSLASTGLEREVSTRFEIQLPATLLFNYPTIQALSAHVHGELVGSAELDKSEDGAAAISFPLVSNLLVSFNAGVSGLACSRKASGSAPSVVFCPAAFGTCIGLQMRRYLKTTASIYSLQSPDLMSAVTFEGSRDRAEHYFKVLDNEKVLVHGVHLVGYSFGGLVVFQLACLCQERDVLFTVTLLDPVPALEIDNKASNAVTILHDRAGFYKQIFVSEDARIQSGLKELANNVEKGEVIDCCELDLEVFQLTGIVDKKTMVACSRIALSSSAASVEIKHARSRPGRLSNCSPVSVFIAESGISWFTGPGGLSFLGEPKDDVYGWSSVFTCGTKATAAKGTHMEFFDHPTNVNQLALHLDTLVEHGFGGNGREGKEKERSLG